VDRNKRRIVLYERGKAARKQERARKARIKALRRTGQPVLVELTILIRDPENDPTPEDLESLEPHPSISQLAVDMWTTDEIKIPQIDPELLVRSQPVNLPTWESWGR
jgi:hypothetical protein